MARNAHQPTLMGYLGMIPMRQMIGTRLFGGPYLLFSQVLTVSLFLYETGAILGRARRDRLSILAKIVPVLEGREDDFINFLQRLARERLEKFGKEPDSFFNFIMSTELEKVGLSLTGSEFKTLKKTFDDKFPLKGSEPLIKLIGEEGIGFGSCFPDLTEKIWRHAYESVDMDSWSEARAYGLTLSEKPPKMSFEEREQTVLDMVAIYAAVYYPELLDPLDLRLPQS